MTLNYIGSYSPKTEYPSPTYRNLFCKKIALTCKLCQAHCMEK